MSLPGIQGPTTLLERNEGPRGPGLGGIAWDQTLMAASLALLTMLSMLNFAPLLPLIREELRLTNAWVGALASATMLSHTLLQLPVGQFIDSIGPRRAAALSLAVMGLMTIGSSLATDFTTLLLCRFLLGFGTAVAFVSGVAIANVVAPPEKRTVVQGIYGAAANVGALIVLVVSQRIADLVGWRGTFAVEGAAMLAMALVLRARLRPAHAPRRSTPTPWGTTLRRGSLYLLGLAMLLGYGVFVAVSTWVTTFLWERHGVGLEWAGPLAAFMAISGVLARVFGSPLTAGRERPVILVCCFATAAGVGLVPLLPGIVPAVLALMLLGWFAALPYAAIIAYVVRVSGSPDSAKPIVVTNFVANIGALTLPPAVGYVLDVTRSYEAGFGLLSAAGLAGSVALLLWLPAVRGPAAPRPLGGRQS